MRFLSVDSLLLPQPVNLKVFIQNDEGKKYCNSELFTGNYTTGTTPGPGGWIRFVLPFEDFRCDYWEAQPTQVDRIDFQNVAELPAEFCLADFELLR